MIKDYLCKLSIVIPVYGSEAVLRELVKQIRTVVEALDDIRDNYEIILVCDNSPDRSWQVIESISHTFKQVRGILLRMNAGQHNALMAGFSYAGGAVIVTMDDDLQHSPSDIPRLLADIRGGSDVVYARFKNRQHAIWKVAGSRLNNAVSGYLMKKPKDLYLSPFRAMKASIRDELLKYRGPYVYVDGLILSVTRNISSVDVVHYNRFGGDSYYGLKKSISLWLKMATNFSIMPLRITSLLGLIFSGLGFFLAVLLVIQKFTLDMMPIGWSSLIVTILIVGGFQLLALGMLGEYLGRVLLTINSKPQYVVDRTVGVGSSSNSIDEKSN